MNKTWKLLLYSLAVALIATVVPLSLSLYGAFGILFWPGLVLAIGFLIFLRSIGLRNLKGKIVWFLLCTAAYVPVPFLATSGISFGMWEPGVTFNSLGSAGLAGTIILMIAFYIFSHWNRNKIGNVGVPSVSFGFILGIAVLILTYYTIATIFQGNVRIVKDCNYVGVCVDSMIIYLAATPLYSAIMMFYMGMIFLRRSAKTKGDFVASGAS